MIKNNSLDVTAIGRSNGIHSFEDEPGFLRLEGLPQVECKGQMIKTHTWACATSYEMRMASYIFERKLRSMALDWDVLSLKESSAYEHSFGKTAPVMLEAVAAAVISNRIVRFEIYSRHNRGTCGVITLSSGNHDISDLIAILDDELRSKNPLRGNLVQILSMNGELDVRMQPKPTVSFDDVIVAQQLFRDELRENTVGAFRTDQNNGIICSGPPGTGKSMACAAAANECIATGYPLPFSLEPCHSMKSVALSTPIWLPQ